VPVGGALVGCGVAGGGEDGTGAGAGVVEGGVWGCCQNGVDCGNAGVAARRIGIETIHAARMRGKDLSYFMGDGTSGNGASARVPRDE
jgi:hypothetical protein